MSSTVWRNINKILDQSDDLSFGGKLDANTWARFLYISRNVEAKAPFKQWCDNKLKRYDKTAHSALKNGKLSEENSAYIIKVLVQGFESSGLLEKAQRQNQRGGSSRGVKKTKKESPFLAIVRFIFITVLWGIFKKLPKLVQILAVVVLLIFMIVKISNYRNGDNPPIEDVFQKEVAGDNEAADEAGDNETALDSGETGETQAGVPSEPEGLITINICFLVDAETGLVDSAATARAPNWDSVVVGEIPSGTSVTYVEKMDSNWYDFTEGIPGCGSSKRIKVKYTLPTGETVEWWIHASKATGWDW